MTWEIVLLIAAGLVGLTFGGDFLVRGASKLAAALGVTPLVIGLTVVAFGTSAPELAVSLQAGLQGNGSIALGNVVGSNIFNVVFILGLCAVVAPLNVQLQLIRLDVPVMIAVSFLLFAFSFNGNVERYEGIVLMVGAVSYTAWLIRASRKESLAVKEEFAREYGGDVESAADKRPAPRKVLIDLAWMIGGVVLLVLGAGWLVDGAVQMARLFGVPDVVIGLTIVAVGTSLPEVVTSVVATLRGERDIAVGNVVGSNIFNILTIVGIAGAVTPGGLTAPESLIHVDMPVMLAVAVVSFPVFLTGKRISRLEGALFLAAYLAYTIYLVSTATP